MTEETKKKLLETTFEEVAELSVEEAQFLLQYLLLKEAITEEETSDALDNVEIGLHFGFKSLEVMVKGFEKGIDTVAGSFAAKDAKFALAKMRVAKENFRKLAK